MGTHLSGPPYFVTVLEPTNEESPMSWLRRSVLNWASLEDVVPVSSKSQKFKKSVAAAAAASSLDHSLMHPLIKRPSTHPV